jgi:hypothetical protein
VLPSQGEYGTAAENLLGRLEGFLHFVEDFLFDSKGFGKLPIGDWRLLIENQRRISGEMTND